MSIMKRGVFALLASLAVMAAAAAADIKDGKAYVKAVDKDRFTIDGNPMGKNMLLGYLQDLKDSKHIEGVVLKNPDQATAEHRHLLKVIADFLQISAYVPGTSKGQLDPIAE